MTGVVKMVDLAKKFGFITGQDKADYFFHESGLKNCSLSDLQKGREVTFEEVEGKKGPRAEDILSKYL